jgi:hypothetical protein
MAKRKTNKTQVPTIWEIPDTVWPMMQTILDEHYPPKPKGASAGGPAAGPERHPLSPAHRLPMEPAAETIRR